MKKIAIYSALFIFLDLLSKYLIAKFLETDLKLIGDFFRLSYAENYGIAFSMKMPFYMIFVLNGFVLLLFIYYIKNELNLKKTISCLASAMIIGGGLANMIDRAVNGYVIDFISIFSYPTFNLADVFISLGVLFLLIFHAKILGTSKIKK